MAIAKVRGPAGWINEADHLLLESAGGLRSSDKLQVLCAEHPARIREIGIRPERENALGQQVLLVHRVPEWKRENAAAALLHHRQRPRRHFRRGLATVGNPVRDG